MEKSPPSASISYVCYLCSSIKVSFFHELFDTCIFQMSHEFTFFIDHETNTELQVEIKKWFTEYFIVSILASSIAQVIKNPTFTLRKGSENKDIAFGLTVAAIQELVNSNCHTHEVSLFPFILLMSSPSFFLIPPPSVFLCYTSGYSCLHYSFEKAKDQSWSLYTFDIS